MPRTVFLIFLAASTLNAASITVFSSCSVGSITKSPCSNDPNGFGGLMGPNYDVWAYANASQFSGPNLPFGVLPPVPGGQGLSAQTGAVAILFGPPQVNVSAVAHASESIMFYDAAPASTGVIEFDVHLDYAHEDGPGAAEVIITDGTHTYSYMGGGGIFGSTRPSFCGIEDCEYTATLPFQLGTPFTISVAANTNGYYHPAGADADVLFNIYSSNGTPVGFSSVPEPSTLGFCGVMLLSAACLIGKRCATYFGEP